MSRYIHHTTPPVDEQLSQMLEQDWQTVVERLPSDYEQQAEGLGALGRKREVRRASDVLRVRLSYVLCVSSFRHLGGFAVLIGLCNISEAAWRKRLRRSRLWLLWLLGALLAGSTMPELPAGGHGRGRVLLVDATRLKQPGGTGDDWRLHTAYDLRAGRLVQVSLSDQNGAESLERFVLSPGDVVVADAGYGYRRCVVWVLGQQADVVVRIHPGAFPLLDEHKQPLDVVAWLKERKRGQHSRLVHFVWQGHTSQVRLIACSLSLLLTTLCLHTLRQVVHGYWTFERFRACLPLLQRFVRGSPRTRQQQEQMICVLRSSVIAADPARHGSVFSWSSA